MFNRHNLLLMIKKRAGKIEKRYRFAISTLILSGLVLISTFFTFDKSLFIIPILIIATYVFTFFSLLEGIEKIGWFKLFLMPIIVTIAFYVFYYLIPGRWLTRLPFIILYAVSIYANLLTSNIFNVGVEKNLQLYRAAFSVNFFYQALACFFLLNLIFSFQQLFLVNALLVGGLGFLLSLHLFWSIRLKTYIDRESLTYALLVGLIMLELGGLLSFISLKPAIYALFLTATYYSLSGLIYHFLDQRLFKETIREYIFVWAFVFVLTILSMS